MATFTGILSSERARNVLKELEAKDGVELMSVPEVTTLSERQAQVQAVDIRTILTGINPKALSAPGVESADGTNGIYLSQSAPFGATLDILPSVTPDGFAIELTVSPAVTEFLGYDPSTQKTPVYVKGKQTDGLRPLPRHRVRQAAAHATVWDGQTLVIGGISPVEVFTKPDGETATEPSQDSTLKHLVVLVTPTIVDHAGNRLHPD